MSCEHFAQCSWLNASSPQCVRDWSGILCERSLRSEQRYSGKPDGVAGTPRKNDKSRKTKDFLMKYYAVQMLKSFMNMTFYVSKLKSISGTITSAILSFIRNPI